MYIYKRKDVSVVDVSREKLIDVNGLYRKLPKNKFIIRLKNNIDYTRINIIGKALVNQEGDRIGKVLDVIGNVSEPYALVLQVKEPKENEKLYIEIPLKGRRR